MSRGESLQVAVIGGGITGLAAALRLAEIAPGASVTLFESSSRWGGVLETIHVDGYAIDKSADMFTTKDTWAVDLCRRIGLEGDLIGVNRENRRALVLCRGKLREVPAGFSLMSPTRFWPIAATPILSPLGKLRMAAEPFVPIKRDGADESLASFATRRLGREAYERLIQPVVGGIYTADPTRLSMQAALPQFLEMETKRGGILRASLAERKRNVEANEASGARYQLFLAPRRGMGALVETLVQAIASKIPSERLRLGCPIDGIIRQANGYRLRIANATAHERYDAIVVACAAPAAAKLLAETAPALAEKLAAIEHASSIVVVRGYRRDQIAQSLNAFGLVVPIVEKRQVLAISFSSIKFAGRAPEGRVLLRTFIGGAVQSELNALDDAEVSRLVDRELADLLGAHGSPEVERIIRWRETMPQHTVGHLDRVRAIENLASELPNLELAGKSYLGVGIPLCIREGERAAERIVEQLQPQR